MNLAAAFDLLELLMALFFVVKGALRGLVGEVMSLLGILGGVYGALRFSGGLGGLMVHFLPGLSTTLANVVAIALIFLAVTLLCSSVGRLLRILLELVWLSSLDHLLGALAGLIKALAVTLMLVAASELIPGMDLSQSYAYSVAALVWPYVQPLLLELAPEVSFFYRRG